MKKYSKNDKKRFGYLFLIWIIICSLMLVRKSFQNDTFYTIKIGELILDNGIDMLDHFSFHNGLLYTYPHWLYDVFIYIIYKIGGFTGIYISTIILFILLLLIVFKTDLRISGKASVSAFSTFVCTLAIAGFATARAQMISFILFALEICFIEMFLNNGKKKYLFGLVLISLVLCNMHTAVWPFYFILYLPYLAEYGMVKICKKYEDKNKFFKFLNKKFLLEENKNIKILFIIMLLSTLTGFLTPLGTTPYTYLIKTMMGNSQKYIAEHQKLTWINSPFTIIIAVETLFLTIMSKSKPRDLFMICGLVLMSVYSLRHLALLALIGTICFSRVFSTYMENWNFDPDIILPYMLKKWVILILFIGIIIGSFFGMKAQLKNDYVSNEVYPIEAVKYIKENIDIKNMKLFNGYNYGSYLLFNDIPVFIDSRADLYTKQFSGLDYDIFDDYEYITNNYQEKFKFYGITHALVSKDNELALINLINTDECFLKIFEDDHFILYEKVKDYSYIITYNTSDNFTLTLS